MDNMKRWQWGGVGVFLLWLFFCLAAYFVVFRPYSPEMAEQLASVVQPEWRLDMAAVGRSLLDLLAAVWILGVAWGIGGTLLVRLKLPTVTAWEEVMFGTGLGVGVLGLGTLALGLVGLLQPIVFYGMLLLGTAVFGRYLWQEKAVWGRWQAPSRPIALFVGAMATLTLTIALMPPTNWDGLFYHLKGVKLYIEAGRIIAGVDIPHLHFPSLLQMLFMLGVIVRGDITAQLLHFAFIGLSMGVVYALATRIVEVKNGWLAVLFLAATPMMWLLGAWSYNDVALAFYSVAALYAFLRWHQHEEAASWLVLSGLCAGLAMSLKYTSVMTPVSLGLLLLWYKRRNLAEGVRLALWFSLPALAMVLPWLLKNWAFTGNPVYPFLFNGSFWDSFRAAGYANAGTGIGWDVGQIVSLPFSMMWGLQDASQDGPMGPFYLVFLPLLLVIVAVRRKQLPAALYSVLFFALVHYAFWVFGVINSAGLWQSRLLLPMFVALCPVLAWLLEGLDAFEHPKFSLRNFFNLAIGFVLVMLLARQLMSWLFINPLAYLSGSETRTTYVERRLGPHYEAMVAINEQLPADAAVLFLWEPRSYYCDLDCRPDSILDAYDHAVYLHEDASVITQAWQEQGVTHLLLNRTGLDFLIESALLFDKPLVETAVLDELTNEQLELVTVVGEMGDYELYVLR